MQSARRCSYNQVTRCAVVKFVIARHDTRPLNDVILDTVERLFPTKTGEKSNCERVIRSSTKTVAETVGFEINIAL